MTPATEEDEFVDAPSEPEDNSDLHVFTHEETPFDPNVRQMPRRSSTRSFVTASSVPNPTNQDDDDDDDNDHDNHVVETQNHVTREEEQEEQEEAQASGLHVSTSQEEEGVKSLGQRVVSSVQSHAPASTLGAASADAESTSSLLHETNVKKAPADAVVVPKPLSRGILARVRRKSEAAPQAGPSNTTDTEAEHLSRRTSNFRNLVKFDIPEDSKRAKVHLQAKRAQMTIQRTPSKLRRRKIKDGLVVKMERMLVRVDAATGAIPDDFDENVNQRVVSRVKDKWREYMIVCRHSHSGEADFVLQLYKTRVSSNCRATILRY